MRKVLSITLMVCMVISCMVLTGCSDKIEVNELTIYKSELVLLKTFTDKDINGDTTEVKVYAYPENDFNTGGIYIEAGKTKQAFDWDIKTDNYPQLMMYDFDDDGMNEIGACFVYNQNMGDTFKYSQICMLEKSSDGYTEQMYSSDEFFDSIKENIDLKDYDDIFGSAMSISSYGEIFDFEFTEDGKIIGRMKYISTYKDGDVIEKKTGEITADIKYASRAFSGSNYKVVPDK